MTQAEADSLVIALRDRFGGDAEAERIHSNGRYRFAVTSAQFSGMADLKRQDLIWQVVDQVLSRDAVLGVSLILAYAPEELEQPLDVHSEN